MKKIIKKAKFENIEKDYYFDFIINIKGDAFVTESNIASARDCAAKIISQELIKSANDNVILRDILHDSKMSIEIEVNGVKE